MPRKVQVGWSVARQVIALLHHEGMLTGLHKEDHVKIDDLITQDLAVIRPTDSRSCTDKYSGS